MELLQNTLKNLEKEDLKNYYYNCGRIHQYCEFMITQQYDRNIRSMSILMEVCKALQPFSDNPPNADTFKKALDLVRTI